MTGPATGVALPEGVLALVPEYLGRQRWFSGGTAPDPAGVHLVASDELAVTSDGGHRLLWAIVSVATDPGPGPDEDTATEKDTAAGGMVRYQLLIGERRHGEAAEFLNGHELLVLGSVGDHYYYDATVDSELSLAWLAAIGDGTVTAELVRPINAEQSNTSLVFDNRFIAKVFRRLHEGANPDIEVTEALAAVEFHHVARPAAVWRRDGTDLAFVQQFLVGGSEGWALALTSLRDLYSSYDQDPREAGGDFAHEASRLGRMTGEMHLAMAQAFGVERDVFRAEGWPAVLVEVDRELRSVVGASFPGAATEMLDQLHDVADPGPAIRVHGDYHLGQVMRTDAGWFVLDSEGEPTRGISERMAFTSPLKDVTGMLRSFQYAAHYALLEREHHEQETLAPLAEGWERRNRGAFVDGYLATPGMAELLPERPEDRHAVTLAFELQKALYELAYEQAYRPEWITIPTVAIHRMLAGSYRGLNG